MVVVLYCIDTGSGVAQRTCWLMHIEPWWSWLSGTRLLVSVVAVDTLLSLGPVSLPEENSLSERLGVVVMSRVRIQHKVCCIHECVALITT